MKRVLCFGLTLAMMMTLLMTSALAVDSEDTMEKTTTADKEQKALRLNDVVSTDDYKENIFNDLPWMCQEFPEYQYPLRDIPGITDQVCLKVFEQ